MVVHSTVASTLLHWIAMQSESVQKLFPILIGVRVDSRLWLIFLMKSPISIGYISRIYTLICLGSFKSNLYASSKLRIWKTFPIWASLKVCKSNNGYASERGRLQSFVKILKQCCVVQIAIPWTRLILVSPSSDSVCSLFSFIRMLLTVHRLLFRFK